MIVHTITDVAYLPQPNCVEIVLSDIECDPSLTATSFVVPVCSDDTVMMAQNVRRGIEIPGGHVEPHESLREGARRECFEEVGCKIENITPIGFLRMTCGGDRPNGYRYPFPVSYQQFYAARVTEIVDYVANDECDIPIRLSLDDLAGHYRPSVIFFVKEALRQIE